MTQQPIRPFAESLPMALLRARENVMRQFRAGLLEHGITEQQWRVLRALSAHAEPINIGQLAEETFLLGPSLSRIVARLTNRELLTRTKDPNDRRRFFLSISAQGHELIETVGPKSESIYAQIEWAIGPSELAQLVKDLNRLADQTF